MAIGKRAKKQAVAKKKAVKKVAGGGGPAPPTPGTIIIIKPQGNKVTFEIGIEGGATTTVTDKGANTNSLNPRVFTPVQYAKANVTIGGITYYNVSCRRVRATLNVGGTPKLFQFEVVDGTPSWWLDGVQYVADTNFGTTDWNDDLTNTLWSGAISAWVRVQMVGNNPDWVDYDASYVEIGFNEP